MNPDHKLYALIGGIVALLFAASLIGRVLRARAGEPAAVAVVDNLVARINAWWGMVGVFAAAFKRSSYGDALGSTPSSFRERRRLARHGGPKQHRDLRTVL